ncbi:MAG: DUF348 domain-containing protein [Firmicutes bacterium]|nr:DUF348 domain-containing protein [Bacillota bacterium]
MGFIPVTKPQGRQLLIILISVAVFLSLGIWLAMAKTVTIIVDQDLEQVLTTWRTDVGGALVKAGIALDQGDLVEPALGQKLIRGMEIRVKRSFPVVLVVDGTHRTVRFTGGSVGELLEQQGVQLGELDRVEPDTMQAVVADQSIRVIRVTTNEVTLEEEIPNGSKKWAEPTLEKGKTKIVRKGQPGLREKIYEVTYEDGQETDSKLVMTRVVRDPRDEIIGVGTREVWHTLNTSRGPVRYREVKDMTATAYYPGPESTGEWADGFTATGVRAGFGIAAVDPKVIPLGTRLYVPGYGHALAADVGGAIKGNRIDLCFETYQEAIQYGRRKVKVYIVD